MAADGAARQDNPDVRRTLLDAARVYRELASKRDLLAGKSPRRTL
jgi:hypothetical protein